MHAMHKAKLAYAFVRSYFKSVLLASSSILSVMSRKFQMHFANAQLLNETSQCLQRSMQKPL